MFEGVGRRPGKDGRFLDIGQNSLNGYERNVLFRNEGSVFRDVAWVEGADREEDGRGLAVLDADGDGAPDLVLRNYLQPAVLLRNRRTANHWIGFRLEGTRSNRDAVGARVRIRAGEAWQTRVVQAGSGFLSGSSRRLHFGLGDADRVDEAQILWPSGDESRYTSLAADRWHELKEGSEPSPESYVIAAPR